MKWQDANKILIGTGSVGVISLFAVLFMLSGVDYTHSGDSYCENGQCEAYINVTTTYWEICFAHYNGTKYENETLFKKQSRSRTLHVNLEHVDMIVQTEPRIPVKWKVPTYGNKWRDLKDGDCWKRGQVNKIKLIAPDTGKNVKWSFILGDKVNIDPWWFSATSYLNITENAFMEGFFDYDVETIDSMESITGWAESGDFDLDGATTNRAEKENSIKMNMDISHSTATYGYYGQSANQVPYYNWGDKDTFAIWLSLNSTDGLDCSNSYVFYPTLYTNFSNNYRAQFYASCDDLHGEDEGAEFDWMLLKFDLDNPDFQSNFDKSKIERMGFYLRNNNTKDIYVKVDQIHVYNSSLYFNSSELNRWTATKSGHEQDMGYYSIQTLADEQWLVGYSPGNYYAYIDVSQSQFNLSENFEIIAQLKEIQDTGSDAQFFTTSSGLFSGIGIVGRQIRVRNCTDNSFDYFDTIDLNQSFWVKYQWIDPYFSIWMKNATGDSWKFLATYDETIADLCNPSDRPGELTVVTRIGSLGVNNIYMRQLSDSMTDQPATGTWKPVFLNTVLLQNMTIEWISNDTPSYTDEYLNPKQWTDISRNFTTLDKDLNWTLNITACATNGTCLEESADNWLTLDLKVNYSLGTNISGMWFYPNISLYNITAGTLTEMNDEVVNQTSTNRYIRICNIEEPQTLNVLVYLNDTSSSHVIKCNDDYDNTTAVNLTTSSQTLDTIGTGTCQDFYCWMDWLNATGDFNFNDTWSVS